LIRAEEKVGAGPHQQPQLWKKKIDIITPAVLINLAPPHFEFFNTQLRSLRTPTCGAKTLSGENFVNLIPDLGI